MRRVVGRCQSSSCEDVLSQSHLDQWLESLSRVSTDYVFLSMLGFLTVVVIEVVPLQLGTGSIPSRVANKASRCFLFQLTRNPPENAIDVRQLS